MVRNIEVEDIMSEKITKPHKITLWAKINGVIITYPETVQ